MYFVEELRRSMGMATASAWLLQEQMNRESRTSGSGSPQVQSASSEEEARSERTPLSETGVVASEDAGARNIGSQAGPVHTAKGSRGHETHEAGNKSPGRRMNGAIAVSKQLRRTLSKSKSESSSPDSSRRGSPVRASRSSNPTANSSDSRARHTGGSEPPANAASRQSNVDSADVSRIQQVLESGGANAGLIFTDAAHSVDLSSGQKRET